jgi:hypothetical protein
VTRLRRVFEGLCAAALLGLVGMLVTVDLMVRAIIGREEWP